VVYEVAENGKHVLYSISSGGGVAQRICDDCGRPTDWSRNGSLILFDSVRPLPFSVWSLDPQSGRKACLLRDRGSVYSARLSRDDRWMVFHVQTSSAGRQVYVAPFHGPVEVPRSEWIAITDGNQADREPYFSPDGGLIYFLSDRDGFRCIWAQRVDAASHRPVDQPFAVQHFHSARRSLANVSWATGLIGLSVSQDAIVFAQGDITGNIWMTALAQRR
jgi:Tol biopolymer transport system component